MTIRLTTAQRSALECAGLDLLYDGADALIDAAWNGRGDFVVTNETRNALVSALHEMSNAEDYVAERDGDRAARGASTALWHLARKINLIDFAR